MDLHYILEEIRNNGYYEKDNFTFINDIAYYRKKINAISKKDIPSAYKQSFSFAVFRGCLYNFGVGSTLNDDYKLYEDLVLIRRAVNLQLNTLPLIHDIKVEFASDDTEEYYRKALEDKDRVLIINSFHYSAYKLLLPYFLLKNCDVHLVATSSIIKANKEKTDLFIAICEQLFGINASTTFVNVEDSLSLLKLYELFTAKSHQRKQILLIFPDGNLGSDKKNNNNTNLLKIKLHGVNIHIRQGIYSLAATLKAPVINVIAESSIQKVVMKVNGYFDFMHETIKPDDFSLMLFEYFDAFLKRENFPSWECIMYLHTWIEKKQMDENVFVDKKTFDKNRYTYFELSDRKYVFDSNYFLSLEVQTDKIKDIVLKNNFYL
ncbi:MAG: hypothetical protein LBS69_04430 [Prevotellaceae bacterium]|jgi:hypothetical protein|nr:hypothetical protein [Prevotellaceae bacterium]